MADKYTGKMVTDYGKRLAAARKHKKLTQAKLGQLVGVRQGTISELEKIGQGSSYSHQMAVGCGVDPHWLATGEGSMLLEENKPVARAEPEQVAINNIAPSLAQSIQVLSQHLEGMDGTTRRRAGRLLAELADDPQSHSQIAQMLDAAIRSGKPEAVGPVEGEKKFIYAQRNSLEPWSPLASDRRVQNRREE